MAVTRKNTSAKTLAWIIVVIGGVLMLAPFYFTFVLATQPREAIYHIPPPMWFGDALMHNIRAINALIPVLA